MELNLTGECQTDSLSKVCMPFSLDCHHLRAGTESSLHSQHLVKFKKKQLKIYYVLRQTRHGKVNTNVNITNWRNKKGIERNCICWALHPISPPWAVSAPPAPTKEWLQCLPFIICLIHATHHPRCFRNLTYNIFNKLLGIYRSPFFSNMENKDQDGISNQPMTIQLICRIQTLVFMLLRKSKLGTEKWPFFLHHPPLPSFIEL